LAELM